ncbi:alpha/beta fold hydrolase [Neorhizobium sp. DT-125]|uniref:alpha/beta fold hydrolase n=1 Tax=Neorhizobium sp. DT-125 TaxID=3396163 RepID=UPI003F196FD5
MHDIDAKSSRRDGPMARPAAEPITFGGTIGLFTPAEGSARSLAVLFASPWGLEEMCTRGFWRILAERLAHEGISSLRFDYPGTGDALDEVVYRSGIETWAKTFVDAANLLGQRSGCDRVVIVAQGIGAVVATQAAERISGLDGIAFLAPVVSGRFHVRELSAFSQIINDKLGLKKETEAAIEIAGLSMPQEIVDDLRSIDLMKTDQALARNAIVFSRSDRPADGTFAAHLRELGGNVLEAPFEGYEKLTSNPTVAVVPETIVSQLVSWVVGLAPGESAVRAPWVSEHASTHHGADYAETAVRLGRGGRLFGIICKPLKQDAEKKPTVLLLSSGYDRLAGWGRSTVEVARSLARDGISSLRFDCANVADSPPVAGHTGQVLYDDVQVADVWEAIDFLESCGMAPVVTAGRCSGAYLGFQSALGDPRIVGLIGVNPVVFQWEEGRSVDEALENPVQTLEHYRRRLFERGALTRILRGEVNVVQKAAEIFGRLAKRAVRPVARAAGGVSARERAVLAGFHALHGRSVPVSLLYSAGDIGLEELTHFFGRDAKGMRRFPNVTFSVVQEADHNFTPRHARAAYLNAICSVVSSAAKHADRHDIPL